ncbi:LysR family transcriptional regulator [Amycolatopsis thermophila]|uniref:DNA-binding transcriptional LysR family regulator n=1 Tax=Amycolatopsis thermophila TaxID=206084 RepID=A0ABU0ESD9_9PSEU|nr:LysR family transcriptional regulator [Amycolatopsis thermophila]MDQ0378212.1 DNA-binding transcriptional LysR family regulator [Amycolatopsis thermophila]
MIDLRRLRVLRVLADHGTVTAAAHALHLTPSAVSQQLRLLAKEVGVDLLRHEGRRVRLTPAAVVLLEHADSLFAQWERARADLTAGDERGTVRLCGVSSAVAALLTPAAARLRADHPRLTTRVLEEESADCYELLLAEEADIAVVLPTPEAPPAGDPRFTQWPLLDDPQDLLVPAGHPLARQDAVELADAAREPWIVKPRNNDTYTLLQVACAAAGFTPRIAHEAKEWFAVSALVSAGFGVCLVPRLAPLPPQHEVVRIPLRGNPRPSRRIVGCVRRGSEGQWPIARAIVAIEAVCAGRVTDERAV